MSSTIRIVGFTGCLRENSYNRAALLTAQGLVPSHVDLELVAIDNLPAFEQQESEAVILLREKIQQADAILIATPEYKGMLPNALKKALNWLTLPATTLAGKPVAIMGIGRQTGTAGEQQQLRQMLVRSQALVLEQPEVYIASTDQQIDDAGKLTDEQTRQQMCTLLTQLIMYVQAAQPVLVG